MSRSLDAKQLSGFVSQNGQGAIPLCLQLCPEGLPLGNLGKRVLSLKGIFRTRASWLSGCHTAASLGQLDGISA
jgi:hypothetical protein